MFRRLFFEWWMCSFGQCPLGGLLLPKLFWTLKSMYWNAHNFFEADFTIRKWKSFPKRGRGVGVIWVILQTFSTSFFAIEISGYETDLASGDTLKQDNISYHRQTRNWYLRGCKNNSRVLAKNWSHWATFFWRTFTFFVPTTQPQNQIIWLTNSVFAIYPARAQSTLRALGLLLADGAPTVERGKTFWRVN